MTRRTVERIIFPFALILLAILCSSGSAFAKPTEPVATSLSCDNSWKAIPADNLGRGEGAINALEIISESDIWGVGYYSSGSLVDTSGIIMKWDGSTWSQIGTPVPFNHSIDNISADAPNSVWINDTSRSAFHWDGSGWAATVMPTPQFNQWYYLAQNPVKGIKAFSPTNVWAFGYAYWLSTEDGNPVTFPYVTHWDGTQWTEVGCGCGPVIDDISAIAPDNIWTLGGSADAPYAHNASHWDGTNWTTTTLPDLGLYQLTLTDIKAVSADDVWIVGYSADYNNVGYKTSLALHWDGRSWQVVPLPLNESSRLFGIEGTSSADLWAVGDAGCSDYSYCIQVGSLVLHWNGTQWTRISDTPAGSMRAIVSINPGSIWTGGDLGIPWLEHYNGTWTEAPDTLTGESSNILNGVAAVAADDIWAVGSYDRARYTQDTVLRTLIQHWDGANWAVVQSPNPPYESVLSAVSAHSSTDIWAVGHSVANGPHNLVEHWDGTQWSIVPVPADSTTSELYGVAALAPDNVWAVGNKVIYPSRVPKILHWDGTNWSEFSTSLSSGYLSGVSAVSANDIWAVGRDDPNNRPFVLHWDGTSWTGVLEPISGDELFSVSAISSTDIWASGSAIVHFDGTSWQTADLSVVLPPDATSTTFSGIVANANGVWVAGSYTDSSGKKRTIALYYDYQNWTIESTENVGDNDNELRGIAFVDANDVWAVGTYKTDYAQRVLTEHYPTLFTDVMPGSTFYHYVLCLACQGIIDGYSDSTFRPNNPLTRGQLAKVVSNAAGFNDPAGAQQYEDVPPGSTFYDFIWRLSDRGFIAGYACGGAGEPCSPDNLPYFRPGGTASRGQISKIVSNAAGFNDPPGSQRFEDVLPGSTFYDFIQRLAARDVMAGYPCGGPGEPCGPNSLPYFRPANNATRGQTAKIVSITFFPQCTTNSK